MLSGGSSRSNLRARGALGSGAVATARCYSGDTGPERASKGRPVEPKRVVVREPGGRPTNKEIIITAGLNAYPSEVESVLREQPSVVDLTVVGLPGDDGASSS